jgi:hypothetical protein
LVDDEIEEMEMEVYIDWEVLMPKDGLLAMMVFKPS